MQEFGARGVIMQFASLSLAGFLGCEKAVERVAEDELVREVRVSAERTVETASDPDERRRVVENARELEEKIRERRTPPFK